MRQFTPDAMPETRLPPCGTQHLDSARKTDSAIHRTGGPLPLKQAAFTLTEVALAMGIFSFALVSMIGLLSVGLKNSRRANTQIGASNLMSAIASDIRSSTCTLRGGTYSYTSPRLNLTASVDARGTVSGVSPVTTILDESGSPANITSPNPLMKLFTVNFAAASLGTTAVRVTVQWPPKTSPSANYEGSLDALIPLPAP